MASWVQGRALRFQAIVAGIVCAAALVVAAPNFFSARTIHSAWPSWLPTRQLNLGIEYAGGISLLLEPDMNVTQRALLNDLRHKMRATLRDRRLRYEELRYDADSITMRFVDAAQVSTGAAIVRQVALDWDRMPVGASPGYLVHVTQQVRVNVQMGERMKGALRERILRSRLDALRCAGDWLSATREGDAIRLVLPLNFRTMAHVHFRPSC